MERSAEGARLVAEDGRNMIKCMTCRQSPLQARVEEERGPLLAEGRLATGNRTDPPRLDRPRGGDSRLARSVRSVLARSLHLRAGAVHIPSSPRPVPFLTTRTTG